MGVGNPVRSASQIFVCFARTSCWYTRAQLAVSQVLITLPHQEEQASPSVLISHFCRHLSVIFSASFFLITRRYRLVTRINMITRQQSWTRYKFWQRGTAFFGSRFASQLAGTRRFFRFSLSLVETHHFLIICRKILFLNKKSTEFLQCTILIIMLYFITVYRRLNVLSRDYPALPFVPHVSQISKNIRYSNNDSNPASFASCVSCALFADTHEI